MCGDKLSGKFKIFYNFVRHNIQYDTTGRKNIKRKAE